MLRANKLLDYCPHLSHMPQRRAATRAVNTYLFFFICLFQNCTTDMCFLLRFLLGFIAVTIKLKCHHSTIQNLHANSPWPDVPGFPVVFTCLSLMLLLQRACRNTEGIRWCASQCAVPNVRKSQWRCSLHWCPVAKSALLAVVSSSCLCSPTACNESSVSEQLTCTND